MNKWNRESLEMVDNKNNFSEVTNRGTEESAEGDINLISIFGIVIANSIPIFGVLYFNWDVAVIVWLFWFENIIIGFFNYFKMKRASKIVTTNEYILKKVKISGARPDMTKEQLILVFILNFTIFVLVQGLFLFIFSLAGFYGKIINIYSLNINYLLFSILVLFISHGISYKINFIDKQEYKKVSPYEQLVRPFSRVMVMQITVLLGAIVIDKFGNNANYLIITLVAAKIYFDILGHIKEHMFD